MHLWDFLCCESFDFLAASLVAFLMHFQNLFSAVCLLDILMHFYAFLDAVSVIFLVAFSKLFPTAVCLLATGGRSDRSVDRS